MHSSYGAGPRSCTKSWYPRVLCDASAVSPWRLRDFEVHCADPEVRVEIDGFEFNTWGGEIRSEFEPQPGDVITSEHWGSSWFREYGSGFAAPQTRYRQAHRYRDDCAYMCGDHGSLCRRARLSGHDGKGCDCELLGRAHGCSSRSQYSKLCQCHSHRG